MSQKSVVGTPGVVYRIPLFFTDVSPIRKFSKKDFPVGDERYAYCRVISDKQGAGILVEVFNYIGAEASENEILSSGRIFDPVIIIGDGIKRNRWQKVFESSNYDPELDSGKSGIEKRLAEIIESNEPVKMWSSLQLERQIIMNLPCSLRDSLEIELAPLDS